MLTLSTFVATVSKTHVGAFTVHRTQIGPQPKPALVEKKVLMQAEQRANTSAVQSALSHALQHVPMTNGANTGGSPQVRFHTSFRL